MPHTTTTGWTLQHKKNSIKLKKDKISGLSISPQNNRIIIIVICDLSLWKLYAFLLILLCGPFSLPLHFPSTQINRGGGHLKIFKVKDEYVHDIHFIFNQEPFTLYTPPPPPPPSSWLNLTHPFSPFSSWLHYYNKRERNRKEVVCKQRMLHTPVIKNGKEDYEG